MNEKAYAGKDGRGALDGVTVTFEESIGHSFFCHIVSFELFKDVNRICVAAVLRKLCG